MLRAPRLSAPCCFQPPRIRSHRATSNCAIHRRVGNGSNHMNQSQDNQAIGRSSFRRTSRGKGVCVCAASLRYDVSSFLSQFTLMQLCLSSIIPKVHLDEGIFWSRSISLERPPPPPPPPLFFFSSFYYTFVNYCIIFFCCLG